MNKNDLEYGFDLYFIGRDIDDDLTTFLNDVKSK